MNVQNFVEIRTPLGNGKIVYTFPDGTYAVEYAWGGGEIRFPNDPDVYLVDRIQPRSIMNTRQMVA